MAEVFDGARFRPMQISLLHLVLLAGAAQGLLLSAMLIALRSSNVLANRFLAAFVALESLHLLWLFLAYSAMIKIPVLPMATLFNLRILGGPLLLLYVQAMTARDFKLRMIHGLHLTVLFPTLLWGLLVTGQSETLLPPIPRQLQLWHGTVWLAFYASLTFVIYSAVALRQLRRHTWRLEHALSSTEGISLWWLRAVICLFIGANVLGLLLDVMRLQHFMAEDPRIWINLATALLVIYLISFGGLRQPTVFTRSVSEALGALDEGDTVVASATEAGPVETTDSSKYRKSGLDEARISELWSELHETLRSQELYREPTLDLPTLARSLGLRPQELSQVISTSGGGRFYDLINDYRVDAAKELLADPKSGKRKLFDIALTAGFSSQSTFYSQFKKRTGKTPAAYRAANESSTE